MKIEGRVEAVGEGKMGMGEGWKVLGFKDSMGTGWFAIAVREVWIARCRVFGIKNMAESGRSRIKKVKEMLI